LLGVIGDQGARFGDVVGKTAHGFCEIAALPGVEDAFGGGEKIAKRSVALDVDEAAA
jgi:hypothetical protein